MKGVYIENLASKKDEKPESTTIKSFYKKEKKSRVTEKEETKTVTASAMPVSTNEAALLKEPSPVNPVILFESCDTLFFRDGTVIAAKIIELNANEIKYRYCGGSETDVIRVVLKSKVEQVIYSTGLKEAFEAPKPQLVVQQPYYPQAVHKKTNGFSIAGFIFSILLYPVLLIVFFIWALSYGTLAATVFIVPGILFLLALLFCIIGLVQISKNKDRFNGTALSVIGLILTLLPLILLLISALSGGII